MTDWVPTHKRANEPYKIIGKTSDGRGVFEDTKGIVTVEIPNIKVPFKPIFQLEDRYVVLKRKDINSTLSSTQQMQLSAMCADIRAYRARRGATSDDFACVVIEGDWKCFDKAVALVEEESEND